jgi:TRAP-type mannitol/chloroaromatic compound transport system permease small subunit
LENIIKSVKRIIFWIGEKSAWLNLLMVLLLCLDVFLRYILGFSSNALLELEWHLFGLIFLLGSAYTLQMDKHVRVDVFYHSLSEKHKSMIDVFGSVFLLIPWCVIAIGTCYRYASNSFYIRENSPNPGGLPAWYVIKYAIVACFVLLLLQAIVLIYEKIKILTK